MKRNSCTQTATSVTSAYSKTGGEIVSACQTQNSRMKHVAIGVQTILPRGTSQMPIAMESDIYTINTRYASSQNSRVYPQSSSKCGDQACERHITQIVQRTCARCNQSSSDANRLRRNHQGDALTALQQTQVNYASDTSTALTELTCQHAVQSNSIQHKQKETKNQISVPKSKYSCGRSACPSISEDKCYKRTLFTVCPVCSKKKPVVEANNAVCSCGVCQKNPSCMRDNNSRSGKACVCVSACECDDIANVNEAGRRSVIGKSRQNYNMESQSKCTLNYNEQNNVEKLYDCTNDCTVCKNQESTEGTLCECRSNGQINENGLCRFECRLKIAERQPQTQIYSDTSQINDTITQQHKVQTNLRCNCDEACSCSSNNQAKDIIRGKPCKSYASKPNFVDNSNINKTERNRKHCRACGITYQNTRKCGCHQMYPKAVAYELSFTKENISRNEPSDITQITPKAPLPKQPVKTATSDTCPCDIIKRNSSSKNPHHTSTLQVRT